MSDPTPPSPAPPSAPPSPEKEASRSAGQRGNKPDSDAPIEVRRARNLYTVVAAFLVFIGITGLTTISETAVAFRTALNDADPAVSEQISTGMIKALLVLTAVATLIVAVGHGLTSQALDGRRSWSRPLGFTFSGILLGLAALNLISGAQIMPSFFFAIAGLLGISLLRRPEVRDYLRPRWGGPNGGPGGYPPGPPPGAPMPGQHPQSGQHPQGGPQQQHPPAGPPQQQWAPHPPQNPAPTGRQPSADAQYPDSGNAPSGENQQN